MFDYEGVLHDAIQGVFGAIAQFVRVTIVSEVGVV